MNSKTNSNIWLIILIILIIIIVLCTGIGVYSYNTTISKQRNEKNTMNNEIKQLKKKLNEYKQEVEKNECSFDLKDLYGTYYGEKEHPNNKLFTHKVELTLKENNEATLHQSDGASSSFTTGSYKCENNRIIYTPLYYDYENQEKSKYNQDDIQYTFIISKGIEIELNYFYANKFPINIKIKK